MPRSPRPMHRGLPILAPGPPRPVRVGRSGGCQGPWSPHQASTSPLEGHRVRSMGQWHSSGDSHSHPNPPAQEVPPQALATQASCLPLPAPAEPSHNSSHVTSPSKPFAKDSPASAAHLWCQAWGPGGTGELGTPRCDPQLPFRSPSPSLTSSAGAAAGKGFAPEPVEDSSRTEEK